MRWAANKKTMADIKKQKERTKRRLEKQKTKLAVLDERQKAIHAANIANGCKKLEELSIEISKSLPDNAVCVYYPAHAIEQMDDAKIVCQVQIVIG